MMAMMYLAAPDMWPGKDSKTMDDKSHHVIGHIGNSTYLCSQAFCSLLSRQSI